MFWLTALVALTVVLAVLELNPDQLLFINQFVSSNTWQISAYLVLTVALVLWVVSLAINKNSSQQDITQRRAMQQTLSTQEGSEATTTSAQPTPKDDTHSLKPITPYTSLRQQGVTATSLRIIAMMFFWLAILLNTLSQRVAFAELSPTQPIYVEALVTPIGLSDKRLTVAQLQPSIEGDDGTKGLTSEVEQGYRQLVLLTDITIITSEQLMAIRATADRDDAVSSIAPNPFAIHQSNETDISSASSRLAPSSLASPPSSASSLQSLSSHPSPSHPSPSKATSSAASPDTLLPGTTSLTQVSATLPSSMTVMLRSYQQTHMWLNTLAVDKQVRMQLLLNPLEYEVVHNATEFNQYRWLSSRHATATAQPISANPDDMVTINNLSSRQWIDLQRFRLRDYFLQKFQQHLTATSPTATTETPLENDAIAVTLSLLTGDRSLISPQLTDLYRFAGISHLLAISGTHVLFLALLCAGITTAFMNRFIPSCYWLVPRWQWAFMIAVVVAFAYAVFAGFDIPAARTAFMLLMVGVLRYLIATPSIFKVLLVLAVGMAWMDAFVLWQAGFWLSFIAVAVLVIYSKRWERRSAPSVSNERQSSAIKHKLSVLVKLQLWMSVALLPLSLWLFGKVSLWGFVVNLFAIGLFGWIIVPLNLLAGVLFVALPTFPLLAETVWEMIFWLLQKLHTLLFSLQALLNQIGWLYADLSISMLCLILFAAIPWLLPKGMISRTMSIVPLAVIAMISYGDSEQRYHPVHITTLNANNTRLSAMVVHDNKQAWLLLSTYRKGYAAEYTPLSEIESQQISNALYDQLKIRQIDNLTGIIVQTASPTLATVVADLGNTMSVSYYWQAGLSKYGTEIAEIIGDTALIAESCAVGGGSQSMTQTPTPDSTSEPDTTSESKVFASFALRVLTGWENIEDKSVWDCTLLLSTQESIRLQQDDTSVVVTKETPSSQLTQLVIHTSAEQQLASLWQLMCLVDMGNMADITDIPETASRAEKVTNDERVETATVDSASIDASASIVDGSVVSPSPTDARHIVQQAPLQATHWLTTTRAWVDMSLIDRMRPLSWYVADAELIPARSTFKEARLYWQQQYDEEDKLPPQGVESQDLQ